MKLFDYIKILFGRDAQWDKLKRYDKSKNSFMTNRFMSTKINEIGERDYKEAMKHSPTEVKNAINVLEKQMSDDIN